MATQVYHIANLLDALVAAVDAARISAAHDTRWLNAISSGYDWLLQQETIEFDEAAHELVFTSENGTYRANGACRNTTTGQPCKAFENGQACRHRSASRIVYRALQLQQQAPAPVAALDTTVRVGDRVRVKNPRLATFGTETTVQLIGNVDGAGFAFWAGDTAADAVAYAATDLAAIAPTPRVLPIRTPVAQRLAAARALAAVNELFA